MKRSIATLRASKLCRYPIVYNSRTDFVTIWAINNRYYVKAHNRVWKYKRRNDE